MLIFWFHLLYLLTVWTIAAYTKSDMTDLDPMTIILSAIFFTCYFCLTLTKKHPRLFQILLLLLAMLVFFTFSSQTFNGLVLLILLVIAIQAIDHLQGWRLYIQLFVQYIIVIFPYLRTFDLFMISYLSLLLLFIGFLLYIWRRTNQTYVELNDTYIQLETEYRQLKRHTLIHEKMVRQEERNQVARDIHDSVGHRLTALLMQLEVARIQASDITFQEKFDQLKVLAQTSLDETREAVKALRSEETTGLTAVIQLIRKLEAESHLRVSFHVQSGALSIPLSNDQSVALYRSVQEGLTNMMRHSDERQASIEFNFIGGRFFRFQISHPLKKKVEVEEGFGLQSMRERLEQLNGSLKINQVEGEFRLIGTFPIDKGE
ncbi:sensor histidine kinase [Amphibacillus sp. MSJ-3]|uniref:sensor histidine kinase n=1 Tax=Amphibacillus sp. MSJ-3 TaxID=2841505 RepID=UPI001C0EE3CE|nr:histidine kinase [Amphibacillus sp. MSJ-3]MBU5594750.1 sensor histidine kinase [Amphibacillus sp. MSJ-3]